MTDVDARADLSRLKLPELQALAAERGIVGASKLRKGELVDALSADDDAETRPTGPMTSSPPRSTR